MQGGEPIGQYRVTGLIGQGGMGVVYAAQHTLIGRLAAIKVLLPEFSQNQEIVTRFFNEARAATAIRHPGIVEIYDFGWRGDGSAYIVMEFLHGEALSARVARTRMPWTSALGVARQIAGALAAAHATGIVHRDLKPDNVFLVPDPEVRGGERIKLLDFGIAKLAGDPGNQHQTRVGAVMGTPTYMAPEQCRGVALDHRADLYSLGCILFELCTGRPPFVGEGSGDLLAAHIHVPAPTVASFAPGVPREIETLVQHLLKKAPADRPQTAADVIHAIDLASNNALRTGADLGTANASYPAPPAETTLSGTAGALPTVAPRSSRLRTVMLTAVAVGVIGVVIGVLAMNRGDQGPDPTVAAAQTQGAITPAPVTPVPVTPVPPVTPTPAVTPPPTTPPPTTPPPTPVQVTPAPTTIEVAIDSTPAGADVLVDGKRVGKTPYRGTLPRADRELKLVLHLSGHKDKQIAVRADAAITQQVTLEPRARPTGPVKPNRDESVNPFGK